MAPVVNPNLGVYLDRPSISLSSRMLQDGFNFRVKEGKLTNLNLGWDRFESGITLNGPVNLIATFTIRDGTQKLIFGTLTDLYLYNSSGHTVSYITPHYVTGTAAASGTAVTGSGTSWSTNVRAGDEICFTGNDVTDPAATWYTIASVNSNTSITLTASAGTIAGHTYTIRKKFAGELKHPWSTEEFLRDGASGDDLFFATNGVDSVFYWNGSTSVGSYDTALAFTCKTLRVYSNMLIYGNLIQSGTSKPTDIINSDVGSPRNVSSGLSEQFKVHAFPGAIQAMHPIGDALAIYSRDTVTVAQFIGDPLVFAFRQVISGTGVISPRGVADFGNFHEFIGADSQYIFDGAAVRETNKHVWRELLRTQDPVRTIQTYNHFDDENAELIWIIPQTTDTGSGDEDEGPEEAATEHYLEEVGDNPHPFAFRRFPFTATGYYSRQDGITWDQLTDNWASYNFRWNDRFFFAAFPFNLAGDMDGKIYTINTSQDAAGAALPSFVRFGKRAVGDGRMRGLVSRIYPFVTKLTNAIDITLLLSDHAMGPSTITDTQSFDQTLPEGGHFSVHYRRGRFMQLEVGSDGPSEPWELSGYDVDIKPGGMR